MAGLAAVLLCAGALSACGSVHQTNSPQARVAGSFTGLTAEPTLTVTLRLAAAPADLAALAGANPTSTAKDRALLSRLVPNSTLSITETTVDGKPLDSVRPAGGSALASPDVSVSIALRLGNKTDLEIRALGKTQTLYVRADVDDLARQTGTAPAQVSKALAGLPPSLSFLKTAEAGGWLSLDLRSLGNVTRSLAGGLGGSGGPGEPASAAPGATAGARTRLLAALERDVTAAPGPSSPLGDHVVLSANSRTIVNDLVAAVKALMPAGGASALGALGDTGSVPSRTVVLDEYTRDGTVSVLQLDLAQLATGTQAAALHGRRLPLELDFGHTAAAITAPATATRVDLSSILSALLGSLGTNTSGIPANLGGLSGSVPTG